MHITYNNPDRKYHNLYNNASFLQHLVMFIKYEFKMILMINLNGSIDVVIHVFILVDLNHRSIGFFMFYVLLIFYERNVHKKDDYDTNLGPLVKHQQIDKFHFYNHLFLIKKK